MNFFFFNYYFFLARVCYFSLFFSTPVLSDSSLPKEDLVKELKTELQRCLAQLKTKREKISRIQKDLQTSQNHVEQLQTQLQGAERTAKDAVVRTDSYMYVHSICCT